MFKFEVTGVLSSLVEGKDGVAYYLRLKSDAGFVFTRPGELPAPIPLIVRDAKLVVGLTLGSRVTVQGVGALGTHEWTKKEFGQVKSKDIINYYFQVEKLTAAK